MMETAYAGKLPKVDLPEHPLAPAIIIERCRPREPRDDAATEIVWFGKWLARWIVFVFLPTPCISDDVLQ